MRKIVILLLGIAAFFGGIQSLSVNASTDFPIEVQYSSNHLYIKSASTGDVDFLIHGTLQNIATTNLLFNFSDTKLIPKDTSVSDLSTATGTLIHQNLDDTPPLITFDYVGANHGYPVAQITLVGHDKVTADLGSVWTDGVNEYTLLKINGNYLYFGYPYVLETSAYGSYVKQLTKVLPVATLTHVSGGTNTSNVAVTSKANGQLYKSINNYVRVMKIDDTVVTTNGTYQGTSFTISETYNILDYKYMVDYMRANPGTPINDTFEGVITYTMVYTFLADGLVNVDAQVDTLKPTRLNHFGAIQSVKLYTVSGHDNIRYYPDVETISTINVAEGFNVNSIGSDIVVYPTDLVDSNKPINRSVEWLIDSTTNDKLVGFTMGYYSDIGDTSDESRLMNPSFWRTKASDGKNYSVGIDNGLSVVDSGITLISKSYRKYLLPYDDSNITNYTVLNNNDITYLYIDYHGTNESVVLNASEYLHKALDIFKSSVGFTLTNPKVDTGIEFSSDNYSSAELFIVDNYLNVAFNTNGGNSLSSIIVLYGNKITPSVPSKSGYSFLGWYKDASFTQPFSVVIDTITEDTTLYAKWTPNTTGGGSVIIDNASSFTTFDYLLIAGGVLLVIVIATSGKGKKKGKWS